MTIGTPSAEIAARHARWRKNRDIVEGEDAVKRRGTVYLPYASVKQSSAEYELYKANVAFFPAASRTLDLLTGLIFRKRPVLAASRAVDALANLAITTDGLTIEQLAHRVTRETLITNFTGLLVDHPPKSDFSGLSAANAFAEGYRPYVSVYPAESILEVTYGTVRNRRKLIRVRLLDSENQSRELTLENGVYVQRIFVNDSSAWQLASETIPTIAGQPWNEIPFVIVSTDTDQLPRPAVMDQSVDLNIHHYHSQARLSLAHMFVSSPIPYIIGAQPSELDELSVAPGSLWEFSGNKQEVEVGYLEFAGEGIGALERERDQIEKHLHTVGARLLNSVSTKNVEAADTHKIKQASENSALASTTRAIAQRIKIALDWFARWVDGSSVEFSLNTDFVPGNVTSQDVSSMAALVKDGLMSPETFFYNVLRDGELVDETLTWEVEKGRIVLPVATADLNDNQPTDE